MRLLKECYTTHRCALLYKVRTGIMTKEGILYPYLRPTFGQKIPLRHACQIEYVFELITQKCSLLRLFFCQFFENLKIVKKLDEDGDNNTNHNLQMVKRSPVGYKILT
jgi:hypothetical protein